MRLESKSGIVTAAASGMGRAGALRFAQEGAAVAVVDLDGDAARAVAKEIENGGGRAIAIQANLNDDGDARGIVGDAEKAFGGLDFVWNHVLATRLDDVLDATVQPDSRARFALGTLRLGHFA